MGAGPKWCKSARQCLAQQDWSLLVVIVLCAVGIAVMEFKDPVQRPVFLYDATISYEHKPNTIDDFLAPLIPGIVFLFSLVLVEVYLFRKDAVSTAAAILRFFMACWAALMVVGFFTELFKLICGRLRPDFLDRCKPALPFEQALKAMNQNDEWGHTINPLCKNADARELRDGRVSFPSGHSSTAYVMGWFGCLYLLWGVSVRADMQMHRKLYKPGDGFFKRLAKELVSTVLLGLMLFQLGYAWGVGVSRFRDNRHNASDIIAGFMLGITFAPAFLLRAIGQHEWWTVYYPAIAAAEGGDDLLAGGSAGAGPSGAGNGMKVGSVPTAGAI
ncbi:phosphatidic acid phosphatase type 2B [Raphidocelis subcapitata]|uniref:Phosphatidic acid phosphatase type 2B n=1 Tax=Raphidocelis subcapitata TaxID=307507 RepID=A0A2V0PF97_9CHLO|nr:phosphatidic acid phosphatase type 2B [Raphidocelis subcapitata]|eukprot:GBF96583.1 phosphatidic acid phosphatase type 2B [Raphidocelis subcapitata]